MQTMPENQTTSNILLIVLWLLLVTVALICRPLMPIDETRYVSVAWEMWQHGNFLVPHLNGAPYSHKPPLLFYLIHLGWFIFGVNEWTARLTGPFFGLLSLFLTARLARRLWPGEQRISKLVPFVLLAMPLWTVMSTLTMFDLLLTFFTLLGAEGLLSAGLGNKRAGWSLLAIAVGGGLLAKGPVVLLTLLPLGLLAPWWIKGSKKLSWTWYTGMFFSLSIGIGITLAWAIPAAKAGGSDYGNAILWGQTTGRMVKSFAHRRAWWWYLPILPVAALPWTGQFLLKLRSTITKLDLGSRFCLSWSIPAFLFLSLISGKQIHYLIPLLPPAALLITRQITSQADDSPSTIPLWTMAFLYIIIGIALVIVPRLGIHSKDLAAVSHLAPIWGIFFILIGIILLRLRPKNTAATVMGSCIAMVAFLILVHLGPFRQLAPSYDLSPMAARIAAQQHQGKKIAIYPAKYSNQFQFAGRLDKNLVAIDRHDELLNWLSENPDGQVIFFSRKSVPSLPGAEPEFSHPFRGTWSSLWNAKTLNQVLMQLKH